VTKVITDGGGIGVEWHRREATGEQGDGAP